MESCLYRMPDIAHAISSYNNMAIIAAEVYMCMWTHNEHRWLGCFNRGMGVCLEQLIQIATRQTMMLYAMHVQCMGHDGVTSLTEGGGGVGGSMEVTEVAKYKHYGDSLLDGWPKNVGSRHSWMQNGGKCAWRQPSCRKCAQDGISL